MNTKAVCYIHGALGVLIPVWLTNLSRVGLTLYAAVACLLVIWRTRNE